MLELIEKRTDIANSFIQDMDFSNLIITDENTWTHDVDEMRKILYCEYEDDNDNLIKDRISLTIYFDNKSSNINDYSSLLMSNGGEIGFKKANKNKLK